MAEEVRLSSQQRRLWRIGRNLGSHLPSCAEVALEGVLDETRLLWALERIVERHEVLRTTFAQPPGLKVPLQVIGREPRVAIERCDGAPVETVRRSHRGCAVDLPGGPGLRAALLSAGPGRHLLMLAAPALVVDGRSLSNLVAELADLYGVASEDGQGEVAGSGDGEGRGEEEVLQYADFSEWQWELLEEEDEEADAARSYWERQNLGILPIPRLLGAELSNGAPFDPAAVPLAVDRSVAERLEAVASADQVPAAAVVLAAWKILLWRLGGAVDPVTSVVVDGRRYEELANGLGPYARCLPVRGRFGPGLRFRDAVRQVARELEEASEHQEHLDLAVLGVDDGDAVSPFGFELDEAVDRPGLSGAPLSFRLRRREVWPERSALALSWLRWSDGTVAPEIRYDGGRFRRSEAGRVAAQLRRILDQVAADPDRPLGGLDLLTSSERHALLVDYNDSAVGPPADAPFHRLVEARAAAAPDRTAVVCEEQRITYGELARRARRVGRRLRSLGVGPEARVAVLAERSADAVVAILAILEAGGAYVAVDPEHPPSRMAATVTESGARALLVCGRGARRPGFFHGPVLRLDAAGASAGPEEADGAAGPYDGSTVPAPENLAYVLFTSGSTGRPKGVAVEHRQLSHYVRGILAALDVEEGTSFATVSTFAADLGHTAVFGALAAGGCLHVVSRDRLTDPVAFAEYLARRRIDVLKIVPSHLSALAASGDLDAVLPSRWLILGGEAAAADLVRRLEGVHRGPRVLNHYGPTETTVGALVHEVTAGVRQRPILPLGRPLAGCRTYVVDGDLRPLPRQMPGELAIGGGGVARGYLGLPGATAERFVPDPLFGVPGSRLYRTGDRVQVGERGEPEFLGRTDDQVKVRGFRVEPGEIRAALAEHPDVRESAVVLRRDEIPTRLVAYAVLRRGAASTADELRSHLADRLPEPMVPAAVMVLDALPLTSNGKVDRDRLPASVPGTSAAPGGTPPRNAVEETLCAVWARVLGVPEVGVFDDFFELGGDSVLVIQVTALANREGIRLEPKHLFERHTIAELAQCVTVAGSAAFQEGEEVAGPAPLTPIQRWFFDLEIERRGHWNQSVLLEVSRPVAPRVVQRALAFLVDRHDALRLRFDRAPDGGWRQEVAPAPHPVRHAAPLVVLDLRRTPAARRAEVVESAAAAVQAGLDLERGPLIRGALMQLDDSGTGDRLLLVVHHLAVDAVSWAILLGDLAAVVEEIDREEPRLPPKTTSFKRWAERLRDHVSSGATDAEADHWHAVVDGAGTRLPSDVPEPTDTDDEASARTLTVTLDEEETRRLLRQVPEAASCRVDEAIAAAVVEALRAWTGGSVFLLELEGHGREPLFDDVDVSRTVGWFTTRFPVRVELPSGADGVEDTLRAVKEGVRAAPGHGIGYGLRRYLGNDPRLSHRPGPEIGVNYLGRLDASLPDTGWLRPASESAGRMRAPGGMRPLPFQVVGGVFDGRLRVEWSYSANRHRRRTVEDLTDTFADALRWLVGAAASGECVARTPSDFPLAKLSATELERLLAGRGDVADVYPLSPLQEGLLFHTLYESSSGLYIGQLDCVLEGDLDVDAFERAWRRMVERHAIFRTSFAWDGLDRPLQVVLRRVDLRIHREDWRDADPEERARRLEDWLAEDRRTGYDLARAPLMRLSLFRVGAAAYRFVWSHHHLLLDGWAVALLADEVFTVYRALGAGRTAELPPARPYRDYIEWLEGQDLEEARRFWRAQLRGFTRPTSLDGLRTGHVEEGRDGLGDHWLSVEAGATGTIRSWLRRRGLTTSTLVQGVWALLLGYTSGEEDVVFGSTVAGRPADLEGFDEMIGLFINTLPVRARLRSEARFAPWLEELQRVQVEARSHEHSPLVEIHGQSDVPRGHPLFESVLVVENYPMDDSRELGLEIRDFRYSMQENFPLIFTVLPGEELRIKIKYERARFSRPAVERMASLFLAAFRAVAPDPEVPLGTLLEVIEEDDREHRLRSEEKLRRAREQAFRRARRKRVEPGEPTTVEVEHE